MLHCMSRTGENLWIDTMQSYGTATLLSHHIGINARIHVILNS